jgi:predicted Zn-dependent protease
MDQLTDRAIGLVQHGKLQEAESLLANLSSVDAISPALPFLLGACRARMNDREGAVTAYDEGLRRAERVNFTSMIPRVRISRAQALLDLGRTEEARQDLTLVASSDDPGLAQEASVALARLNG